VKWFVLVGYGFSVPVEHKNVQTLFSKPLQISGSSWVPTICSLATTLSARHVHEHHLRCQITVTLSGWFLPSHQFSEEVFSCSFFFLSLCTDSFSVSLCLSLSLHTILNRQVHGREYSLWPTRNPTKSFRERPCFDVCALLVLKDIHWYKRFHW